MGTAYTPGLKVSEYTRIDKVRRLPLKGEVLVKVGDRVNPDTVVAKTDLPGIMQTIKLAELLGVEPADVSSALQVKVGDRIRKGDLLAKSKGLFGLFKSEVKSTVDGILEVISPQTGHLQIRQPPTPIERDAYVEGTITQVIESEGVTVECYGALVQGIFGVGGERRGAIVIPHSDKEREIQGDDIGSEHKGCLLVGGSSVTGEALEKAVEMGVAGLIVGAIVDKYLIAFMRKYLNDPNYDIGVAITGHEPIPFSLILTEGFGTISMAKRTFELLRSLEGKECSFNGATQIRAGVIRPEVITPLSTSPRLDSSDGKNDGGALDIGSYIRIIREPNFGGLGRVIELPAELQTVESETKVRVLKARLDDGSEVLVPRANVELIVTN